MPLNPVDKHKYKADVSFDGGELDCGNGLLLLIRKYIDPLRAGQLLEIRSTEISVEEDLPAWCRLTSNELVSFTKTGKQRSFLVSKGKFDEQLFQSARSTATGAATMSIVRDVHIPEELPKPEPATPIEPLSVMGIGSWPRPDWMLNALQQFLEGRLERSRFDATADDAVRLAVAAQIKAGVDVVCDGEQRRDNYASFIGSVLDNCQLVPLVDLLPLVDDPEKFEKELQSLDVPADKVRHPAVFGPLGRRLPLVLHDLELMKSLTDRPIKVALPGPYLLSRIMWLECIAEKAYDSRESMAKDIVRVLREEVHFLLAAGASLVQFDEPVLSEVAFAGAKNKRSFMCGALSESGSREEELEFAFQLIDELTGDLPRERLAMHVCRGNWTTDESVALTGGYEPLLPLFNRINIGTLFLEFCTERAGSLNVLHDLRSDVRVGIGAVNPKRTEIENVEQIVAKADEAIAIIGFERTLLCPDCGFATFADSPVSNQDVAFQKLNNLADAAAILRKKHL